MDISMDISLVISMVTPCIFGAVTWDLVPEGKQVPGSGYCVFAGKAIIGLLPAGTLPLDRVLHGGEVHGQPGWRVSR